MLIIFYFYDTSFVFLYNYNEFFFTDYQKYILFFYSHVLKLIIFQHKYYFLYSNKLFSTLSCGYKQSMTKMTTLYKVAVTKK